MTLNIEDLTIKQVREITALLSNNSNEKSTLTDEAIGKYAIVRTRNEGINFGKVLKADSTGIVVEGAQRIYHHKPADSDTAWYEGVAKSGLHADSKISIAADKTIIEDYSITLCSDEAIKSIKEHKPHGS